MNYHWFKPWKWLYQPVAWQGWVLTVVLGLFCLNVLQAVDRNTRTAGDMLYGLFPFWVPAFLLWIWIASKTSKE